MKNWWADEAFKGRTNVVFFAFGNAAGENDKFGLGKSFLDSGAC